VQFKDGSAKSRIERRFFRVSTQDLVRVVIHVGSTAGAFHLFT
jgi:hypothetical protein